MNTFDDWLQFSDEFRAGISICNLALMDGCITYYGHFGISGCALADYENMMLMGAEIAR